jgi:transcriptional regulator with XRE-family HTH domain
MPTRPADPQPPFAFRHWRRSLGLSQVEAADRLGLKRRMVQYYETGVRDGRPVEVPLSVRLACWALGQGIADFDGRSPTGDAPGRADD